MTNGIHAVRLLNSNSNHERDSERVGTGREIHEDNTSNASTLTNRNHSNVWSIAMKSNSLVKRLSWGHRLLDVVVDEGNDIQSKVRLRVESFNN